MTKDEATAFLERNPRIAVRLNAIGRGLAELETLYWFGYADNEADAKVNIVEVLHALKR